MTPLEGRRRQFLCNLEGAAHRTETPVLATAGWCAYAAPAMYLAMRPQPAQRSVTCERGGGGTSFGVRSIEPEHDGHLSGVPVRSLAIRFSACAGLNVAGRGLRILISSTADSPDDSAPVRRPEDNPLIL
jgi:hypothetical protein